MYPQTLSQPLLASKRTLNTTRLTNRLALQGGEESSEKQRVHKPRRNIQVELKLDPTEQERESRTFLSV